MAFASSCAVFPDRAILPTHQQDDIAVGGAIAFAGRGPGGADSNGGQEGHAGGQGGADGVSTTGGAPVGQAGAAGEPAGGSGGEPTCPQPQTLRIAVDADTWLDEAEQNARHGTEPLLSIRASDSERRALFALTLPPTPPGALLERATFVLRLSSNADTSLAARRLGLYHLATAFDEARASWSRYDNGSKWQQPGGDFGPELATAVLASGMLDGDVQFDVTQAIGELVNTDPASLAWLVLEVPGTAAGELSFVAREGQAVEIPTLVLQYCDR